MTDSHTHIYMPPEADDATQPSPEQLALNAFDAGVDRLVFPNIDVSSVRPMLALHRAFPGNTYICAGLHPTEVTENWEADLNEIFTLLDNEQIIAIGEVGIDLYWDKTFRDEQIEAFRRQCLIASERELPVIIHQREALDEVLGVIRDLGTDVPRCVFHSFTGNPEDAEKILEAGDFMFGINGVVTFKNARELRDALPAIGIDRILLETDSPYLAPVPKRGHPNQSAYLPYIAEAIAKELSLSAEDVSRITDSNASRFFRF